MHDCQRPSTIGKLNSSIDAELRCCGKLNYKIKRTHNSLSACLVPTHIASPSLCTYAFFFFLLILVTKTNVESTFVYVFHFAQRVAQRQCRFLFRSLVFFFFLKFSRSAYAHNVQSPSLAHTTWISSRRSFCFFFFF